MKRFLLPLLAVTTVFSAGCFHFRKKDRKPKENPAIATQVEEEFKQRWIEKRGAELVSKGVRPDLAREQALNEFRVRYGYTNAAFK
ncbi:hypothetical protein K0B96_15195 [Horticoccus luteus]|uniref:Uncharacterized protein n=1 Tax=Horticoccus luteus TaxID=2862869 RepID=A0A8F9TSX1_9BACT|nr:hypothetical protein [Horticoccus luteus]QYM78629.1 hypothetical protein K0B96_15195 [Horticoccus luteus]